jgi:hypothetical protein
LPDLFQNCSKQIFCTIQLKEFLFWKAAHFSSLLTKADVGICSVVHDSSGLKGLKYVPTWNLKFGFQKSIVRHKSGAAVEFQR